MNGKSRKTNEGGEREGGRQVGNPRIDAVSAPWHCLTIIQRALGTIPRTDLSLFSLTFPHNNCLQKELDKVDGERRLSSGNEAPQTGITETVHKFGDTQFFRSCSFPLDPPRPLHSSERIFSTQHSESFIFVVVKKSTTM